MARITNIKISFHLPVQCTKEFLIQFCAKFENVIKVFASFFVYRAHGYVYIIFFSGHVNVTSIKCLNTVPNAIFCLLHDLNLSILPQPDWICDNITADGAIKLRHKVDLSYICKKLREQHQQDFIQVRFNTQKFPGCFLKTNFGTVLFFNTGKYVLVGLKSQSDILLLEHLFVTRLCAIINEIEHL